MMSDEGGIMSDDPEVSGVIYPNPNTGEFIIKLSGINAEEFTSIQIKNMLGENVYSVELNSDELNHSIN
jgi:hypothetical protein